MTSEQLTLEDELNRQIKERQKKAAELKEKLRVLVASFLKHHDQHQPDLLIAHLYSSILMLNYTPGTTIIIEELPKVTTAEGQVIHEETVSECIPFIQNTVKTTLRKSSLEEVAQDWDQGWIDAVKNLPLTVPQKIELEDAFIIDITIQSEGRQLPSDIIVIFFSTQFADTIDKILETILTTEETNISQFRDHLRIWAHSIGRPVVLRYPQEIFGDAPAALTQLLLAGAWLAVKDLSNLISLLEDMVDIANIRSKSQSNRESSVLNDIFMMETLNETSLSRVKTNHHGVPRFAFSIEKQARDT